MVNVTSCFFTGSADKAPFKQVRGIRSELNFFPLNFTAKFFYDNLILHPLGDLIEQTALAKHGNSSY